jgi:aspartate aminotransferase-like enzyme
LWISAPKSYDSLYLFDCVSSFGGISLASDPTFLIDIRGIIDFFPVC